MLMTGEEYRESLRRYRPRVFVDGDRVESVADESRLRPGINALAITYEYALDPRYRALALAAGNKPEQIVKVRFSKDGSDDRVGDVGDEGVDNLLDRKAKNERDREFDHVAGGDEILEFLQQVFHV